MALWWQNVNVFNKQTKCDKNEEWQYFLTDDSNSLFLSVYGHDTASQVNFHKNQTTSPTNV